MVHIHLPMVHGMFDHHLVETTQKPPGNPWKSQKPPGNSLETTWKLTGNHLATTWQHTGNHLKNHGNSLATHQRLFVYFRNLLLESATHIISE